MAVATYAPGVRRRCYGRTESVMEPGEYALRGSILDLYPPGLEYPLRLDFFGDELESIKSFDSLTLEFLFEKTSLIFSKGNC